VNGNDSGKQDYLRGSESGTGSQDSGEARENKVKQKGREFS